METSPSPTTAGNKADTPKTAGPLRVVCFSTYVEDLERQTPRHVDVRNFLQALRGQPVDGVSRIPVGDGERALESKNSNDSIDWFGEMVALYLESARVRPPFSLVPVPTYQTTLDSSAPPWTQLLAISVSAELEEAEILDVLRWRKPVNIEDKPSAAELFENLALIDKVRPGPPVILVDHVFQSGGTLRACAARLAQQGARVPLAVCAGRNAGKADHDPFTIVTGELRAFDAGH